MVVRNGSEYIEGLRRRPRDVWIKGRHVTDVASDPVWATDPTCVPFTYRRTVLPSYVTARKLHAFAGNAALPYASAYVPPAISPPSGFDALLDVASK